MFGKKKEFRVGVVGISALYLETNACKAAVGAASNYIAEDVVIFVLNNDPPDCNAVLISEEWKNKVPQNVPSVIINIKHLPSNLMSKIMFEAICKAHDLCVLMSLGRR
jgi:hypothetical protein